jgi:hypothetical protein
LIGSGEMAFEGLGEWAANFSLGGILDGDFSELVPIFYLAISIAFYSIIIWHFYRFVAKRDCFSFYSESYPKIVSLIKYFVLYPLAAFLFFAGFSLMLLFLSKNLEIITILSTSFAIISAIRITAYYSDDLSKDVAKMLPFALLGVFLVDPSYVSFEDIIVRINTIPEFINLCLQFIILIVLLEWILRITLTLKNEFCETNKKKTLIGNNAKIRA